MALLQNTPKKITPQEIKAAFPPRPADAHKGTFGHLLLFCGSYGMAGAAILAAKAALRSGVGLLTVAVPQSVYPIVSNAVPEAVCLPLEETQNGVLSPAATQQLLAALDGKSALLIGCGLGLNDETKSAMFALLEQANCPIVLDADGLNALSQHIDTVSAVKVPLILTPHPGEMARLVQSDVAAVQKDRVHIARDFAAKYAVVLALKGHHTVVTDGCTVSVNPTGNAGMATGGSGDVLAGMIASFVAQGISPLTAAKSGVFLHGAAGDMAAKVYTKRGMLPSDLLIFLPKAFQKYHIGG